MPETVRPADEAARTMKACALAMFAIGISGVLIGIFIHPGGFGGAIVGFGYGALYGALWSSS